MAKKTGCRICAIEHHDRFDWPTAKHTITRPGALPQAMMSIAFGEKNRVSHWAIEHRDRFDWPTAKHTITRPGALPQAMMNIAFGEKNRVSHLRHRTSRPVRLANGHTHHSQGHRPWDDRGRKNRQGTLRSNESRTNCPSNITPNPIGQRPCTP
ncbi:MAG: hypothetical protein ACK5LQ_03355 [Planctomycetota bacterium]